MCIRDSIFILLFFFLRDSSPLFSITRRGSFLVIHVSVNIQNNAEKYTTLLLFFLSKSPGGHVISFQIKPWVAFGLPYLLIELFLHWYSCGPDGRSGGRSVGRSVYGLVITKFCRMSRLPHFLSYGARRAWSSSITTWSFIVISTVFVESHDCSPYLVHSVEAELESILPLIAVWQKSTYKLKLWRNTKKGNKHKRENHSFWASVFYGLEKLHRFHAICKEKKSVQGQSFHKPGKKCHFSFPPILKDKCLSGSE